jgi:hypothetical protein
VVNRLERTLSDIQRRWVPDLRLGVFDVALGPGNGGGSAVLQGVTTSRDAAVAVQQLGAAAGLGFELRLLPDSALRAAPAAVVTAALAPLVESPAFTAARVSDALHGEPLDLLERRDEWLRVRARDGYHAWTHHGYVATGPVEWADDWTRRANARAAGAELRNGDTRLRLPISARVVLRRDDTVETADGRLWSVTSGAVRREAEWRAEAGFIAAPEWALRWLSGSPFLPGGRSDWGIDASGLVQATYAARGRTLPRDSDLQAVAGRAVPLSPDGSGYEAGDVLCFVQDRRVRHVALWSGAGRIVHAVAAIGGVGSEDLFGEEPRMRRLLDTLVAVRRMRDEGQAIFSV